MASWQRAVGPGISEQTQPIRIQNRILYICVSNSVWMQQLQFMKGMILGKIKEETGVDALEEIRFFIGEVEANSQNAENLGGREESAPKEWGKLSESEMIRVRRETANLIDPEMRNIFERVFAQSLSAGKSLRKIGEKERK